MTRLRALTIVLAVATVLAGSPAGASGREASSQVPLRLSTKGKIVEGGNAAQLRVGTVCLSGWEPLEAFVYLVQDGHQSQYGSIPITCDGVRHVYAVSVAALDVPFHEGEAAGTAYVLLLGPGGETVSGQDDGTITLMA
jgi:hypothetical protein